MNATGTSAKMTSIKQEYASALPTPKPEVVAPVVEEKKEGKKVNPWMTHVKAFRASNPALSYKEVLKQAKTSYKKA
jgi:hypothetical protein